MSLGFWYELVIGIYVGCITPFAIIGIFEVYYTNKRRSTHQMENKS